MAIGFEIWEGEGTFTYPDEPFESIVDELDGLLDRRDAGRMSPAAHVSALEKLVARQPDFIDGHTHLGYALLDQDKPRKALEACLRGIAIGDRVIPPDFTGTIPWGHLDNRAGNWVAGATALRHGFGANGYIAEILAGNPDPVPLPLWHGSNFAEPELAKDYVSQCGDLWNRTPYALAFLRWLHSHPKILIERAAILECQGETPVGTRHQTAPPHRRPVAGRPRCHR